MTKGWRRWTTGRRWRRARCRERPVTGGSSDRHDSNDAMYDSLDGLASALLLRKKGELFCELCQGAAFMPARRREHSARPCSTVSANVDRSLYLPPHRLLINTHTPRLSRPLAPHRKPTHANGLDREPPLDVQVEAQPDASRCRLNPKHGQLVQRRQGCQRPRHDERPVRQDCAWYQAGIRGETVSCFATLLLLSGGPWSDARLPRDLGPTSLTRRPASPTLLRLARV